MVKVSDQATGGSGAEGFIKVEVIYAEPRRYELVQVELPTGSTLQQALESSGLIEKFPEIGMAKVKLGIYGKISKANTLLRANDRIEIYRSLIADPKEIRLRRAATVGQMRKN